METLENDYSHIKGWGVDADPENEPTYPMKKYTGDDHSRINWERPPLQTQTVEILHSNERPGLSAVFGTSTPPSGLSGTIRRFAFKYSENRYRHWLPLLLADRVNVVEGLVDDFHKGKLANILNDRGIKSELKYNAMGLTKKAFIGAAASAFVITLLFRRK